jgi:hypothetical protein
VSIIGPSNGPRFRKRRSWKSRLLELSLWVGVAIVTAAILVMLSERILPANF